MMRNVLPFETTESIPPLEVMVGQERAVKAVEFGLFTKNSGYNIYISGLVGTGKMTYAKTAVAKVASSEPTPPDLCYVNNFDNPSQPIALALPAGLGSEFRQDMRVIMEDLKNNIPKVFSSDDYEQAKTSILKKFQDGRSVVMDEFGQKAEKVGILPQWTSTGFAGLPIRDGKPLTPEEFQLLDREKREELEKKMLAVHEKAMEAMRQVQLLERETREQIKGLDTKIGLFAVGHLLDDLAQKYREHDQVLTYLEAVKQDVVKNINDFKPSSPDDDSNPLLMFRKSMQETVKDKYQVNLFVDNKDIVGAPIVVEINPTYYNLIGRVEYEARMGVVNTDFSMIKSGALHRANGGYLILNMKDVLTNIGSWEALKRILKTKMITIENLGEQYGMLAMASLKPQPITLNVKLILVGNAYLYHLIFSYDEDFRKLFKVFADFDTEMENNLTNIQKLAGFVASTVQRENLKHFNRGCGGQSG